MKKPVLAVLLLVVAATASALAQEEVPIQASNVSVDAAGCIQIQVESSTDYYYVLYCRHDVQDDAEFAVSITLGEEGTSTHYPGMNCSLCHSDTPLGGPTLKLGGTVFTDSNGITTMSDVLLELINEDGGAILTSNDVGNIAATDIPDGNYRIKLGEIISKTWHRIPEQGSCNVCHEPGDYTSAERMKLMHDGHTSIPADNGCTYCHYFPASMAYEQLQTPGVLEGTKQPLGAMDAFVEIKGVRYPFDPNEYKTPFDPHDYPYLFDPNDPRYPSDPNAYVHLFDPNGGSIETVRPDVFAPGYYSLFDIILAVAERNGIHIDYEYDEAAKTHWINAIDGVLGDYWYHWAFDTGGARFENEFGWRRCNRWDEILWKPGTKVAVVEGEDVAGLKQAYHDEIERENAFGSAVDIVKINIKAKDYQGNPEGSGRITVSREFNNVALTAHDLRASTAEHIYSKPFQPGVVTVADIAFSLEDQNEIAAVYPVFYDRIAGSYIDSFYVQGLGFPDVGIAHASGSQGFICRTHLGSMEGGTNGTNVNEAKGSMHIPLDLQVIHSPNYSKWQWMELGNPYYEETEPEIYYASLIEDHDAIDYGFNLHHPYQEAFSDNVTVSYNVFELTDEDADLSIQDQSGQIITTLLQGPLDDLGVHTVSWQPQEQPSGTYNVVMRCNNIVQTKTVTFQKIDN
jgi:hypothetical protein